MGRTKGARNKPKPEVTALGAGVDMSIENSTSVDVAVDDMGPDVVGEPAATATAPASIHLTPELLQMLLQNQSAATIEAIREFKRLPPDEQERVDRERERKQQQTRQRLIDQHARDERQATAHQSCSHRQPNGKTRFRGQGLSNGYSQAFCPECHYLSPPFKLTMNEIQGGVNMDQWTGDVWAVIQQRVRQSAPPPPVDDIPPGARILF